MPLGWINPNARCPVCGAAVYFYGNQNGSRVFFDEVGPPWPKHPCTDNGSTLSTTASPSRRDFSVTSAPGRAGESQWRPYAVQAIAVDDGISRITLQRLAGAQVVKVWRVEGRLPLQGEDVVFVRGKRLSYFNPATAEPVMVEKTRRGRRPGPAHDEPTKPAKPVGQMAARLITERDRQHVLARLDPGTAARVRPAVRTAITRGDLALALGIDVSDLEVAPPRPADLWTLAIAFLVMVAAAAGRSYVMIAPGVLLMAIAVYRLNPDIERGARIALAILTALAAICPASVVGAIIQHG